MKRRELLTNAAGLAAAGLTNLLWAPRVRAANPGHDAYFARLNAMLKAEGPGRPVMLIDRQRMNHNVDSIAGSVGKRKTYRAVVKSLPSVRLLQHVTTRAETDALMVFHQPFLNEIAKSFPRSDALLGKPMPVAAARTFYQRLGRGRFDPARQVQWLIDSHARLLQYQSLAREFGVRMRVNFEIDVGLRRGGFESPQALAAALGVVQRDPEHLQVSGLMGYEPHLTGMKADLEHPAVREVLTLYRGHIDQLKAAGLDPGAMTLNGAGSHTLRIYERDDTMNDLSAGSAVVKPTDFDTHHLRDALPALFIATPILKRYDVNPIVPDGKGPNGRLFYIYGGYWKADMVSPAEVGEAPYKSTNQSPITTSTAVDLQVDDYMFLRPTQSEFVMLQFGDLLTVDDGRLHDRWPVFHQTG